MHNPFSQSKVTYKLILITTYNNLEIIVNWLETKTDVIASFEKNDSFKIDSSPNDIWEISGFLNDKPVTEEIEKELNDYCNLMKIKLPEISIEKIIDKDWVTEVNKNSIPIIIGDFYIHGSHIKEPNPNNKIPILLNAGRAFGTGEHESTSACLILLSRLNKNYKNILDMGCGSAILAIAAAKKWNTKILAVDIDQQSIFVAQENAKLNKVDSQINYLVSDGFNESYIQKQKPYELIFANILANPLIEMAHSLVDHLNNDGVTILSGFLLNQKDKVLEHYLKLGTKLIDEIEINNWSALCIQKQTKN